RKIEEAVKRSFNPERIEEMTRKIEEAVKRSFNPERVEEMTRKIEEAVKKNINPERMEQLGREIEEAVKKNINPERMERLGREIEESVKKNINPERMEQLSREIQEAVKKSIEEAKANAPARSESRRETSPRPAERRPEGGLAPEASRRTSDREIRDLEQRLRSLEEKLDRALRDRSSNPKEDETPRRRGASRGERDWFVVTRFIGSRLPRGDSTA